MTQKSLKSLMQEIVDEDPKLKEDLKHLNPRVELARALIHIRRTAGMTRQQVAEVMDCDESLVTRMESATGEFPTVSIFSAYAHTCHSGFGLLFVADNNVLKVSMSDK